MEYDAECPQVTVEEDYARSIFGRPVTALIGSLLQDHPKVKGPGRQCLMIYRLLTPSIPICGASILSGILRQSNYSAGKVSVSPDVPSCTMPRQSQDEVKEVH